MKVVFFGLQGFIKKYLIDYFNDNFFNKPFAESRDSFVRMLGNTLGGKIDYTHIEALHNLGYLPIEIKALKEGTLVPIRVPCLTIVNTVPEFFWLTNFLETLMSCELWQPITSATIALQYRKIVEKYAMETVGNLDHVRFQCHDFSMRGMSSVESAMTSGAGHLLSFDGTDTIPAIMYLESFYNANVERELVGTSIPATEHSVMCSYGDANEFDLFKHLITEVYPDGIFSAVADTWDLWKVCTQYLPQLKEEILARDGKLVIRPDSGDPVQIICGKVYVQDLDDDKYITSPKDIEEMFRDFARQDFSDEGGDTLTYYGRLKGQVYKVTCDAEYTSERGAHTDNKYYILDTVTSSIEEYELTAEDKGVIELLWETFGGEVNELGYKVLDSHIGAIYGDSITLDRADRICACLQIKGFASSNIVFGVGSFTYQFNTRDTFCQAMKATYAVVNGEERLLFKDPITDNGTKKSQRGMVVVIEKDGEIGFVDGLNKETIKNYESADLLELVFKDGKLIRDESLADIRKRVRTSL